jgi:hypothetical protein
MNTTLLRQGQRFNQNIDNGMPRARAFKLGRFIATRWPAEHGVPVWWQATLIQDTHRASVGYARTLRELVKGEAA